MSSDPSLRRFSLVGILLPLAFVGSCVALIPPAFRLADPLTRDRLETPSAEPFPILVLEGDNARVIMVEDLRNIPPLPVGATYLVPSNKEASVQRAINANWPPELNNSWVLKVERPEPSQQKIELYLIGDGYWGGAYDATERTVNPRYRKRAGPGFAFIALPCALTMNAALWGVGWLSFARCRSRRAASR